MARSIPMRFWCPNIAYGKVDRFERPGICALLHIGPFDRLRTGLVYFTEPARIAILFPELGWFGPPGLGKAPLFDFGLLGLGIALLGIRHDSRVDDLPTHGEIAPVGQRRIAAGQELIDGLGFDQTLAEQPHRVASGTCLRAREPGTTGKTGDP